MVAGDYGTETGDAQVGGRPFVVAKFYTIVSGEAGGS